MARRPRLFPWLSLAVATGIWYVPQVWFLVLAIHGSVVLSKLCNTVSLWRNHPLMRQHAKYFHPATARLLCTDWLIGRAGGANSLPSQRGSRKGPSATWPSAEQTAKPVP